MESSELNRFYGGFLMSMLASTSLTAPIQGMYAPDVGNHQTAGVVEINLLLPSQWADDLMALSRERQQSVGEILRSMIGQALHDRVVQS
jgi:hypothetical protein